MYTRITRSGGRSYLQIVEGFRSDAGVRQRVVANLGRMDEIAPKHLDALINGLQRALGRVPEAAPVPEYDTALAFGDVYALNELWSSLGFGDAIRRALRSSRRSFDAEALVRAMVFNRLCAPDSKLGCLEWLETVAIPNMPTEVAHDQLLRTMDALMDHAEAVESRVGATVTGSASALSFAFILRIELVYQGFGQIPQFVDLRVALGGLFGCALGIVRYHQAMVGEVALGDTCGVCVEAHAVERATQFVIAPRRHGQNELQFTLRLTRDLAELCHVVQTEQPAISHHDHALHGKPFEHRFEHRLERLGLRHIARMHGMHQRQPIGRLHHAQDKLARNPAGLLIQSKRTHILLDDRFAVHTDRREIVEHH